MDGRRVSVELAHGLWQSATFLVPRGRRSRLSPKLRHANAFIRTFTMRKVAPSLDAGQLLSERFNFARNLSLPPYPMESTDRDSNNCNSPSDTFSQLLKVLRHDEDVTLSPIILDAGEAVS